MIFRIEIERLLRKLRNLKNLGTMKRYKQPQITLQNIHDYYLF
jgi:hypothetical protein